MNVESLKHQGKMLESSLTARVGIEGGGRGLEGAALGNEKKCHQLARSCRGPVCGVFLFVAEGKHSEGPGNWNQIGRCSKSFRALSLQIGENIEFGQKLSSLLPTFLC